jgi:hypothetical protein
MEGNLSGNDELKGMKLLSSIRFQILLFFFIISLVSSLLVSLPAYYEQKKLLHGTFTRELNNTASLIQMSIDGELKDAIRSVTLFTESRDARSMDKKKLEEGSAYFVDFVNIFYNLYIYDKNGDLVTVTYFDRENVLEKKRHTRNLKLMKKEFSDTAYAVLNDGKPRFTKAFWRRGELLTAYVSPIYDERKTTVMAIVSCGIFVNNPKLKNMLKALVPPYSGFICLIDKEGNVFGKEGEAPYTISTLPLTTLQNNLKSDQPMLTLNNQVYCYTLKKIDGAELYVLVGMSNRVISDAYSSMIRDIVIINVFFFLVALVISSFIGHYIGKSVKEIVDGLRDLGKGNYSRRITTRAFGEMSEAIDSFNETAEKLQKNTIIEKVWDEQWKSEGTSE